MTGHCAPVSRQWVVVGGGLLGLEAGNALRNLGLKTHAGSSSQSTVVTRLDRVAVDGFPYVLAPSWSSAMSSTSHRRGWMRSQFRPRVQTTTKSQS